MPVALIVAHVFGVQQGALVIAARAAVAIALAIVAWRVGGPRGEALRDVLMHPRGRAFARAEFDVVTALPRLLVAGLRGPRRPGRDLSPCRCLAATGRARRRATTDAGAAVHEAPGDRQRRSGRLVALLLDRALAAEPARRSHRRMLGALDAAGLLRDAAQPA